MDVLVSCNMRDCDKLVNLKFILMLYMQGVTCQSSPNSLNTSSCDIACMHTLYAVVTCGDCHKLATLKFYISDAIDVGVACQILQFFKHV